MSLPLLLVILIAGIVISVLQVLTQIQDPSIAFIPRLLVFLLVLGLLGHWLINKSVAFGVTMLARLAY